MKIMIVDDERPAIEQLVDLLNETGKTLDIHTYQNAKEALDSISRIQPDLLFLDIEMPGLTGISFAEQLLENNISCNVVFVTAYAQYALKAFDVMAMDYLLKPVDKARLVRTLERVEGSASLTHTDDEIVQVTMFGNFKVECAAGRVVFNTVKAEELLAYLILKQEASIHQIMEDLFVDFDLERARWYVHTCLYQIRASLKRFGLDERIRVNYTKRKYSVTLTAVLIDIARFDEAVLLEEKVKYYQGGLLADIDAFWKVGYANAYEDACKAALKILVSKAEAVGDSDASTKYRRILQELD